MHNSLNIIKAMKLCTLNGWIVDIKIICQKLFFKKINITYLDENTNGLKVELPDFKKKTGLLFLKSLNPR